MNIEVFGNPYNKNLDSAYEMLVNLGKNIMLTNDFTFWDYVNQPSGVNEYFLGLPIYVLSYGGDSIEKRWIEGDRHRRKTIIKNVYITDALSSYVNLYNDVKKLKEIYKNH